VSGVALGACQGSFEIVMSRSFMVGSLGSLLRLDRL
jgi:hypothetical protein